MTTTAVGSNKNFAQNQIQNAVVHPLSAAPAAPRQGQIYFNTATNIAYVWNGTTWRPWDAAALTDGSIPFSGVNNIAGTVKSYPLSSFAAPTANIPMAGFTLTGLPAPTAAGQAGEYSWVMGLVQNAAAGISSKAAVAGVYTANVSLSGLTATQDSTTPYTPTAGQRMLVTANTTASQNGPYIVASGAWTRVTTDSQSELDVGATWLVENGGQYAGTSFRLANPTAPTVGTTSVNIVQFTAATPYTAGNGMSLSGTVFAVNPVASGGILATSSGVSLDTTVAVRKFAGTITHDGSTLNFAFTHNLNNSNPVVSIRDSSGVNWDVGNTATSANALTVGYDTAQANGTVHSVMIMG